MVKGRYEQNFVWKAVFSGRPVHSGETLTWMSAMSVPQRQCLRHTDLIHSTAGVYMTYGLDSAPQQAHIG
jgi:hypothetical protein